MVRRTPIPAAASSAVAAAFLVLLFHQRPSAEGFLPARYRHDPKRQLTLNEPLFDIPPRKDDGDSPWKKSSWGPGGAGGGTGGGNSNSQSSNSNPFSPFNPQLQQEKNGFSHEPNEMPKPIGEEDASEKEDDSSGSSSSSSSSYDAGTSSEKGEEPQSTSASSSSSSSSPPWGGPSSSSSFSPPWGGPSSSPPPQSSSASSGSGQPAPKYSPWGSSSSSDGSSSSESAAAPKSSFSPWGSKSSSTEKPKAADSGFNLYSTASAPLSSTPTHSPPASSSSSSSSESPPSPPPSVPAPTPTQKASNEQQAASPKSSFSPWGSSSSTEKPKAPDSGFNLYSTASAPLSSPPTHSPPESSSSSSVPAPTPTLKATNEQQSTPGTNTTTTSSSSSSTSSSVAEPKNNFSPWGSKSLSSTEKPKAPDSGFNLYSTASAPLSSAPTHSPPESLKATNEQQSTPGTNTSSSRSKSGSTSSSVTESKSSFSPWGSKSSSSTEKPKASDSGFNLYSTASAPLSSAPTHMPPQSSSAAASTSSSSTAPAPAPASTPKAASAQQPTPSTSTSGMNSSPWGGSTAPAPAPEEAKKGGFSPWGSSSSSWAPQQKKDSETPKPAESFNLYSTSSASLSSTPAPAPKAEEKKTPASSSTRTNNSPSGLSSAPWMTTSPTSEQQQQQQLKKEQQERNNNGFHHEPTEKPKPIETRSSYGTTAPSNHEPLSTSSLSSAPSTSPSPQYVSSVLPDSSTASSLPSFGSSSLGSSSPSDGSSASSWSTSSPSYGSSAPSDDALRKIDDDKAQATGITLEMYRSIDEMLATLPTLNDIYKRLDTIQMELKEKDELFQETIDKLNNDWTKTVKTMKEWDEYYHKKIGALDKLTAEAGEDVRNNEQNTRYGQVARLREQLYKGGKTAAEKIHWLGSQLQGLKVKAHEQQIETSRTVRADQSELNKRLDELKIELERQMRETETEKSKAEQQRKKRIELEDEIASVKRSLQSQVEDLQSQVLSEQQKRADEQLKKSLDGSHDRVANAVKQLEKEPDGGKSDLKAEEYRYRQLQESSQRMQREMEEKLRALRSELDSKESASNNNIAAEEEQAKKRLNELKASIEAKEAQLRSQATFGSAGTGGQLEVEVSSLKREHANAISQWEKRCKTLEAERDQERRRVESMLTQVESEARIKITEAKREAEDSKKALKKALKEKEAEHKEMIQRLRESSDKKQQALSESLTKTSKQLQELKYESDRQLREAKNSAQTRENELLHEIRSKENEMQKYLETIGAEADRIEDHRVKAITLERELGMLKQRYDDTVREHDKRYKFLQETLEKQRVEAQEMLSRKESEARDMIEAARREANDSKAALRTSLAEKDDHYGRKIEELRGFWKQKERELLDRVQEATEEFQRDKLEAHKAFMMEKQALTKKQDELRAKIAEKEKDLREQIDLTKVQGTRAQEFWQRHSELENEVTMLKNNLKQTEFEWESKLKKFQADQADERRANQAKQAQVEAEAQKKIDVAVSDANEQKAALEKTRRERDDEKARYCKSISELEALVKKKDGEMEGIRKSHELKLQQLKQEKNETLRAEHAAAISKQKDLLSRIEDREKEIRERDALLSLEKAKSKDLWESRAALEEKVKDLKTEHAEALLDWENKHQAIKDALEEAQRSTAEELARQQQEAREQIEAALAEAESCRAKLVEGLQAKDAQHRTEVETLRELSRGKQKELSDRIATITEEFNAYKFDAQKCLVAQEEQAVAVGRRQLDAAEEGRRHLAERIRKDFTQQLVKKEVDILRHKAELKQKDAEIAALKGESIKNALSVRLDLSNVKKKVSKILRRDYDGKKVGSEDLSDIESRILSEVEKMNETPVASRSK